MEIAIIVLSVLVLLYVVLVFAPAVVFYKVVFSHAVGKKRDVEALDLDNVYCAGYSDEMEKSFAFLRGLEQKRLSFEVEEGVTLYGVLYFAKSDKTAVLLHGYNAGPINNFCLQASLLYRRGFNVLILHQRAHGRSGGVSTMGIKECDDLLKILPKVVSETSAKQVLIYGISMGCSAVAYASDRLDADTVKGIVLDCGFTSPYEQLKREMVRRHLPVCLIGPLLLFFTRTFLKLDIKQPTTKPLARCAVPALFLHGGADITVPIEQGRENYEACASKKTWYSVEDAPHTMCYPAGGKEAEEKLLEFINEYFI